MSTVALVALAGLLGCGRAVTAPARLHAGWERGMNVTAYSADAYGAPSASRSLTDLRTTGTNHVALVPFWYMASITSSTVAPDRTRRPPTPACCRR